MGVSQAMPPLSGITPLTCTIFDPIFCGWFQSAKFAPICVFASYCQLSSFLLIMPLIAPDVATRAIQWPTVMLKEMLQFQKRKRYNTYLYCIFFLLNISLLFLHLSLILAYFSCYKLLGVKLKWFFLIKPHKPLITLCFCLCNHFVPWQINRTFIIVFVCSFLFGNAQFCGCFWLFIIILFHLSTR